MVVLDRDPLTRTLLFFLLTVVVLFEKLIKAHGHLFYLLRVVVLNEKPIGAQASFISPSHSSIGRETY